MLPKNKTKTTNATQFHTQHETQVESPGFDLTGLLTILALIGIIGFVVCSAVGNGRDSRQQNNEIIHELIKERAR